MFCPKCGSILMPKKSGDKKVFGCSCGYRSESIRTTISETLAKEKQELDIVEKEEDIYPETDEVCPKCGHKKAKFWTIQTRAGDEAETKFFKCMKCKHVWREY